MHVVCFSHPFLVVCRASFLRNPGLPTFTNDVRTLITTRAIHVEGKRRVSLDIKNFYLWVPPYDGTLLFDHPLFTSTIKPLVNCRLSVDHPFGRFFNAAILKQYILPASHKERKLTTIGFGHLKDMREALSRRLGAHISFVAYACALLDKVVLFEERNAQLSRLNGFLEAIGLEPVTPSTKQALNTSGPKPMLNKQRLPLSGRFIRFSRPLPLVRLARSGIRSSWAQSRLQSRCRWNQVKVPLTTRRALLFRALLEQFRSSAPPSPTLPRRKSPTLVSRSARIPWPSSVHFPCKA